MNRSKNIESDKKDEGKLKEREGKRARKQKEIIQK